MNEGEKVVVYDGECALCCQSVNWLAARDRSAKFKFVPGRSELARRLLNERRLSIDPLSSVVLLEDRTVNEGSAAVFRMLAELPAPWRLLRFLSSLPHWLREPVYQFVARHRHRLPGGHSCPAPDHRFGERALP